MFSVRALRGFTTTASLNKRTSLGLLPRFTADVTGELIPGSLANKLEKNFEITLNSTVAEIEAIKSKRPLTRREAIIHRKLLYKGFIRPQDYNAYLQAHGKINQPSDSTLKHNDKIRLAIENDEPHFNVGGKNVYLPDAAITLLPPIAKLSPHFARFRVPKYFNKLDLRDYLYSIYGLRVFNISTSLTRKKFLKEPDNLGRWLTRQHKIMIVEMEKPFVWPTKMNDDIKEDILQKNIAVELDKHNNTIYEQIGSDSFKPLPENIFDGCSGSLEPLPQPFISKKTYKKFAAQNAQELKKKSEKEFVESVDKLIEKL
ncbi:hypothetical protein QEN19_002144 [Hanseniaspora menglaensis]